MLPERKLPQGPWETTRLIGGRCTGAQACQPSRTNRPRGLISPRECARKCGSKNTRHPVSVSDLAGDLRAGATPVPIPNTAVKPGSVDGTADGRLWESRPPPAIPFEARTRTPVRASCFRPIRGGGGRWRPWRPAVGGTGTAAIASRPGTPRRALAAPRMPGRPGAMPAPLARSASRRCRAAPRRRTQPPVVRAARCG
jgi:hypothetical protein